MEKIFKLKYPFDIEQDGLIRTVEELKLKRLKVKDLKKFTPEYFKELSNGMSINQVIPIIASMNNMKVEDLDQLDMADILVIIGDIENFF
jgi:hypothetical protein